MSQCPLESVEMRKLKQWCDLHYICKKYSFAIPNGGFRNPREAKNLIAEGVRPGVSDWFLPYPANGFFGLFIEMKRSDPKKSRVSALQKEWIDLMLSVRYKAHICYGADSAIRVIENYLKPVFHYGY
jgi:hypothetical protein